MMLPEIWQRWRKRWLIVVILIVVVLLVGDVEDGLNFRRDGSFWRVCLSNGDIGVHRNVGNIDVIRYDHGGRHERGLCVCRGGAKDGEGGGVGYRAAAAPLKQHNTVTRHTTTQHG